MPAIIHILLKRQEYTDIDSLTVVLWGVEHLRVLSQVGIDDLVQLAAERDRDAPDPTEALGRELEHWLRWWEARRAEYPGL
jgi:hypothetical protein